MEIKAHIANHWNVFESSSIKRTGNHLLGLVSMKVLDDISVICAGEIQIEKIRKQRAGKQTALLRSVSMRG